MSGGREPTPVGGVVRLALRAARDRLGSPAPGREVAPRRKEAVERREIRASERRVRAHLALTGGEGMQGVGGPDGLVSPTYPALWETALVPDLLRVAGFPVLSSGLLHLESELINLRPLRVGEPIRTRLEIDGVEREVGGTRLSIVGRSWNSAGQLCVQDALVLRIGKGGGGPRSRRPGGGGAGVGDRAWESVATWKLTAGLARRYARLSGDYNPIHLWGWSARPFGFARPILHGFCTQALVAHALIRSRLQGDPAALRRLQVRFRAPLLLPARVELQVAPAEGSGRSLRLVDEDTGRSYVEGGYVG